MKPAVQPAGLALAAFFALVPAISVGGALAMAVLVCTAGALAFRPSLVRQAFEKRPLPVVLIAAMTLWAMTTTLWSPMRFDDQVAKLAFIVPLGAMFVASATADASMRRLTLASAIAGVVVLIPLLAVEATQNMLLNHRAQPDERVDLLLRNGGRGTTVLLALLWPALGALLLMGGWWRLGVGLAALAGAAWLAPQFDQLANAIAFVGGLAAFAIGLAAPRFGILLMTGGLGAWLLAAPFLTPIIFANQRLLDALPLSAAIRVGIWEYVCQQILTRPWLGHGLEATRAVTDRMEVRGMNLQAMQVHPHSASLHIWYETGLVGAGLGAAALIAGGLWLARRYGANRPGAAAACASLASLGFIANVSYGLWAEWWLATLFLAAAFVGSLLLDQGSASRQNL